MAFGAPRELAHAALLGAALWLLNAPRPALGQFSCNFQNLTAVCQQIGDEAEAQCLEYEQFDISGDLCYPWKQIALQACLNSCANCSQIALGIRAQCRFQLQLLNNGDLMSKYCQETRYAMELYRCPAVTLVTEDDCKTDEAIECMRECGNFGGCTCRDRRGTVLPPLCTGFTRVDHLDFNPGVTYTCDLTPWHCMHHMDTKCGKYKFCPPDLCLIKQVTCVPQEHCLQFDVCHPGTGLCYFKYRPNGYNCTDGVFYTLDDQCIDGLCVGTPDFCVRYNVTCKPHSPCLYGGKCHIHSGRCTYEKYPDGVPCDDGRPHTLEDQCQGGACVGKRVDLCEERGVICTAPNSCFDAGVCDKATGRCSEAVPARGPRSCDDGDPSTTNDVCIDGLCLGSLVAASEFLTLGEGECTDREGNFMGRYAGDVQDEQECIRLCEQDQQCSAYSYAFPLCSIYGTVRTSPPVSDRAWAFQEGSVNPPAIIVEKAAKYAVGQRSSICRRKGFQKDVPVDYGAIGDFSLESNLFEPWKVAVFFCGIIVLFFICPLGRALKRCFSGRPSAKASSMFLDTDITDQMSDEPTRTLDALRTADAGDDRGILTEAPPMRTRELSFPGEISVEDSDYDAVDEAEEEVEEEEEHSAGSRSRAAGSSDVVLRGS